MRRRTTRASLAKAQRQCSPARECACVAANLIARRQTAAAAGDCSGGTCLHEARAWRAVCIAALARASWGEARAAANRERRTERYTAAVIEPQSTSAGAAVRPQAAAMFNLVRFTSAAHSYGAACVAVQAPCAHFMHRSAWGAQQPAIIRPLSSSSWSHSKADRARRSTRPRAAALTIAPARLSHSPPSLAAR